MERHEYWVAQNTGWSNGVSWFDNSDTRHDDRQSAFAEALAYAKRLPDSRHRVKHVITIEHSEEVSRAARKHP